MKTYGIPFLASSLCVLLATPAHAIDERSRAKPENTVEACSDHLDNDFDGFEDCDDQDCQELAICASRTAGAKGGGGGGRVVYVRSLTPVERRARAMNKIIAGSLMLSFSVVALGIGAGLYVYGFGGDSDYSSGRYYGGIAGGTLFSLGGVALLGAGGAFLAIGSADLANNPAPSNDQVPVAQVPALRVAF